MTTRSRRSPDKQCSTVPPWNPRGESCDDAHSEATQSNLLARGIASLRLAGVLAPVPAVTVYDCKNTQSLPGTPVANPGDSSDMTAKRAFDTTHAVIDFYRECFGRNSVDDAGMTLMSSIHYGVRYDNAFWNGSQMTYGDGDGQVFTDFTKSDDVIGHELTHGVTQFTAGLNYSDEPGALNESVSDVFGAMFHQWRRKQTVAQADWLVGPGVLGPVAIAKGIHVPARSGRTWLATLPIAATVALPRLHSPRRSA